MLIAIWALLSPGPKGAVVPLAETKKRAIPFRVPAAYLRQTFVPFSPSSPNTVNTFRSNGINPVGFQGTQFTESENHPSWRTRNKRVLADIGGNFFTQKTYVDGEADIHEFTGAKSATSFGFRTVTTTYRGPVLPLQAAAFPSYINSSNSELNGWGAKAIAACKPTNPVADSAVFLGETVREGLPSLIGSTTWRSRTLNARNAGSEYLNAEFGWRPLISDMHSFGNVVNHAHRVLSQFERDSGKVVRRRMQFPPQVTIENTTVANNVSPWTPLSAATMYQDGETSKGKVVRRRVTTRDRWFSGAFSYYVPMGDDARSRMARYAIESRKLLGISPTPDVVWKLAPWSWAVDWFSSAGAVISNLTDWAVDGLVLKYGYIMEHTTVRDTYYFEGPTGFINPLIRPLPMTLVAETKVRRKASPFGFGITWDGLSPRQIAIAVALGITHVHL